MLKFLGIPTVVVWGGVVVLAFIPNNDYQKLHAYIEPATLEGSIGRPQDALYLVRVDMEFVGKFLTLKDNQPSLKYSSSSQGNAFAVDAWGNLMTNGHIVDPEDLLLRAFEEYDLETLEHVCICEPKSVDSIKLRYRVENLKGDLFTTEYEVTADWHRQPGNPCPVGVEILTMSMQTWGQTGRIILKAVDDQADLAVITIPFFRQPFLRFGSVSSLGPQGEVYNFALRCSDSGKSLEIRWGKIELPCFWEEIGKENRMVSRLRMFGKFGNSGSPLLSTDGSVVAVVVGKSTLPQDKPVLGTYGVPAEYMELFLLHATGQTQLKPELNCESCGLPDAQP